MMKQTRYYTVVLAALLPVLVLSASQSGCGKKDDEEVKPIASAPPPPPPPAPTAPAVVTPEEDAGPDAAPDADASDGKVVTGTGVASQSIAKCCAALQQNANSAPLEQKGAYQAAASACLGLKSTPVAQQAFAQLRSFLAGAKMPGACQ